MLSVTFKTSTRLHLASTTGRALRSNSLRHFHRSWKSQEHFLNADAKASTLLVVACSLELVTVDTDVEFDLAAKYQVRILRHELRVLVSDMHQVRALPTVIAFKDGKKVDQFVGALNEGGIRQFLAKL
ncbi:uncharacterized protein EDB91DRAFT_1092493 [Suillus paluster]|uniref:uncharacterized protein n=1 Tax=Suillus paluster TaxID=48578 RepID=UPI001B85DD96|nr:uncharacterized protein EDB91DRAFT_1092493 [Suillus paluster]KAG1756403.1 hypothetical protein EDB91DRAFT_1092493 [Suillus paluster]